jgi:hypothetical protein
MNEAMARHRNEKSPTQQQMVKHSHAHHCCVLSSTILLKPPVMVWRKLWGYKFIDHLFGTLRCDHDGLFVFRLYKQTLLDWGRWMPTLGQCSWVCEQRTANQVAFTCNKPSSHHGLTYQWTAFGDGASNWFSSRQNAHWISVTDPIQIMRSTACTLSLTPHCFMSTNFKGHCFSSNTCTQ